MKVVTVKIPESLYAWLTARAKELDRSKSDIIRAALEHQQQGDSGPNCLDLMQDVCGSISGPTDLSTNPKHLKDFGR